ncbi:MAG: hypothetical protein V4650_13130 [Pseudomonadota bacterium]
MRHPAFQKSLLVLALVLGQWLGFAHGFKHAGLVGGESSCEMCLYAHGLDDALPAAPPQALTRPAPGHEAPGCATPVFVAAKVANDYPIRGPPVLSA